MSERHLTYGRIVSLSALAGGIAGLSLYRYVRSALALSYGRSNTRAAATIIEAFNRREASASGNTSPYPSDVFPGARDVETPYGTMRVYEWGPEEGEKVVLLHGIGTPCIALGKMAHEFVASGRRVLLFGKPHTTPPGWSPC